MVNRRVLRIRVFQFLYSYEKTFRHISDFNNYSNNLFSDLEKSIDLIFSIYLEILSLPVHFYNLNLKDKSISQNLILKKTKSNYRFSQNEIINNLGKNKFFLDTLSKHDLDVKNSSDNVKEWYKLFLKDSVAIKYEKKIKTTKAEDFTFLKYLYSNFLLKDDEIDKHYLNKNLFWIEDKIIVKSMIKKTFNELNSIKLDKFAFAELSDDLSDDKNFAKNLYSGVLDGGKYFDTLIGENSQNWDIERISAVDRILLKMGICEFINFQDIPVKVTINEYIDIAKKYSTPKSKKFINGVLDVLSKNIKDKINKTGKGLIDNK